MFADNPPRCRIFRASRVTVGTEGGAAPGRGMALLCCSTRKGRPGGIKVATGDPLRRDSSPLYVKATVATTPPSPESLEATVCASPISQSSDWSPRSSRSLLDDFQPPSSSVCDHRHARFMKALRRHDWDVARALAESEEDRAQGEEAVERAKGAARYTRAMEVAFVAEERGAVGMNGHGRA